MLNMRFGVDLERAEQLAHHLREVGAQPRHAAELQRVRDLVQRDPAQQFVGVGLEADRGLREVRRDEQQPRRRLGLEDRELVLAQHPLAEQAGDGADLDCEQRARGGADGAGERPEAATEAAGDGIEHGAQRRQVASIQSGRSTGSGVRQRLRLQPRVPRDQPRALLGRAGDVLEGGGLRRGLEAGDPLRDGGGELPVDHPLHGGRRGRAGSEHRHPRQLPSARPVRAATSGECGIRSSGAPSGVAQRGNATSPPASRTISCPAAASTERQPRA